jgi:hypothetical protein
MRVGLQGHPRAFPFRLNWNRDIYLLFGRIFAPLDHHHAHAELRRVYDAHIAAGAGSSPAARVPRWKEMLHRKPVSVSLENPLK